MIYRVYNQGEIPSIAHGWRSVIALPPGRKWITLIDWTTLETCRMDSVLWQKLKPQPATGINLRKVRVHMRRRLQCVTATQAIKDAINMLKEQAA
jgi:hypothetical protein